MYILLCIILQHVWAFLKSIVRHCKILRDYHMQHNKVFFISCRWDLNFPFTVDDRIMILFLSKYFILFHFFYQIFQFI